MHFFQQQEYNKKFIECLKIYTTDIVNAFL